MDSLNSIELLMNNHTANGLQDFCTRQGKSINEGVNDLLQSYNDSVEELSVSLSSEQYENFSRHCEVIGVDPKARLLELISERVNQHRLNRKMLELQKIEGKDKQMVFKVPISLLDKYSDICNKKDIPMSRELRHFIRKSVAEYELNFDKGVA